MKKLTSIVLSLMILVLPLCTAAESDEAFEFVFRNGIKWGNNMSTVSHLELEDDNLSHKVFKSGDKQTLLYMGIDVSQYRSSMEYYFDHDSLYAVRYEFRYDEEKWNYLTSALSEKYGEPASKNTDRAADLLKLVYDEEDKQHCLAATLWEMTDGTAIVLYVPMNNSDMLFITYIDTVQPPEPVPTEVPATDYDLTGL